MKRFSLAVLTMLLSTVSYANGDRNVGMEYATYTAVESIRGIPQEALEAIETTELDEIKETVKVITKTSLSARLSSKRAELIKHVAANRRDLPTKEYTKLSEMLKARMVAVEYREDAGVIHIPTGSEMEQYVQDLWERSSLERGLNVSENAQASIYEGSDVSVRAGVGLFVGTDGFSVGPNLEVMNQRKGYGILIAPVSASIGDAVRMIEVYKGNKRYHSTSPITIGIGELMGGRTALDAMGLHLPLGFVGVIVELVEDTFMCKTPNFQLGRHGLVTTRYDDDKEMLYGRKSNGRKLFAVPAKRVPTPWFFETIFQTEEEYFAEYGYPVAEENRIYVKESKGNFYDCSGNLRNSKEEIVIDYIAKPKQETQPLIEGGFLGDLFGMEAPQKRVAAPIRNYKQILAVKLSQQR